MEVLTRRFAAMATVSRSFHTKQLISTKINNRLLASRELSSKSKCNVAPSLLNSHIQPFTNPTTHHLLHRSLSTNVQTHNTAPQNTKTYEIVSDDQMSHPLTTRERRLVLTPYQKLKPSFVHKRVTKLKTYIGKQKNIRGSPWKLNLVCQFAAGQTVQEAMRQLSFNVKSKAPLVKDVIRKTANLANIRDGIKYSRLEVAECFATHGKHLKRINYHSRGRAGVKHRRHAHMRVVLREIDFNLKIAQAETKSQKQKWIMLWRMAMLEEKEARKERDEMEELEKQAQAVLDKKKENEKK